MLSQNKAAVPENLISLVDKEINTGVKIDDWN